ncbi:guanylate kinase [Babesia caballi]|uniref:guanylate kinase n=1 Tax=Babesia caballi TaxID=5871 RepID=A0AAV4LV99_BABCB|nr:guanylate kinase [Babesia caballi]
MAQKPVLVIVGPSGVGKTTLYRMLLKEFSQLFELSVSYTTRAIRPNELHGVNYYYISNDEFNEMKSAGEFLECTSYVRNQYGTSMREIERIRNSGKVPLLEIEMDGYNKIKAKGLPMNGVFVTIPNIATLKSRLLRRGSHTPQELELRLQRAMEEIEEAKTAGFGLTIVNEVLDEAYSSLRRKVLEWYNGEP